MEHAILIIQGERFSKFNRSRSFQAAQLRGIKVGFIFSRRKPLGSETTKCPSLAKRVLQMAERNLVD
jgi:hypothetical protein